MVFQVLDSGECLSFRFKAAVPPEKDRFSNDQLMLKNNQKATTSFTSSPKLPKHQITSSRNDCWTNHTAWACISLYPYVFAFYFTRFYTYPICYHCAGMLHKDVAERENFAMCLQIIVAAWPNEGFFLGPLGQSTVGTDCHVSRCVFWSLSFCSRGFLSKEVALNLWNLHLAQVGWYRTVVPVSVSVSFSSIILPWSFQAMCCCHVSASSHQLGGKGTVVPVLPSFSAESVGTRSQATQKTRATTLEGRHQPAGAAAENWATAPSGAPTDDSPEEHICSKHLYLSGEELASDWSRKKEEPHSDLPAHVKVWGVSALTNETMPQILIQSLDADEIHVQSIHVADDVDSWRICRLIGPSWPRFR